jgi:hypothetical protein
MLFELAYERLVVAGSETGKQQILQKIETYLQTIKQPAKDLPYASKHLTFQNPFI